MILIVRVDSHLTKHCGFVRTNKMKHSNEVLSCTYSVLAQMTQGFTFL